jgi:hypothetical protein
MLTAPVGFMPDSQDSPSLDLTTVLPDIYILVKVLLSQLYLEIFSPKLAS